MKISRELKDKLQASGVFYLDVGCGGEFFVNARALKTSLFLPKVGRRIAFVLFSESEIPFIDKDDNMIRLSSRGDYGLSNEVWYEICEFCGRSLNKTIVFSNYFLDSFTTGLIVEKFKAQEDLLVYSAGYPAVTPNGEWVILDSISGKHLANA